MGAPSYSLTAFALANAPPYTALSYTWNHPIMPEFRTDFAETEDQKLIICNGRSVPVTNNLADFFEVAGFRLRNRWLWVDALCINQSDLSERSLQVATMGEIYSNAEQVMVWLGKPDFGINAVKYVIKTLVPTLFSFKKEHGLSIPHLESFPVEPLLERLKIEEHELKYWLEGFYAFVASRSWFFRAWIIQEFSLARQVQILCGHSEIIWSDLVATHTALSALGLQSLRTGTSHDLAMEFQNPIFILNSMRAMCEKSKNLSERKAWALPVIENMIFEKTTDPQDGDDWCATLVYLASLFRPSMASDDRDKIFALLGLAKKLCDEDEIICFENPDYSASVIEIYTQFQEFAVCRFPRDALRMVEYRVGPQPYDLPSWVPNFSVRAPRSHEYQHGILTYYVSAKATKKWPKEYEGYKVSGRTLIAQGLFGDQISDILSTDIQDNSYCLELLRFVSGFPKTYHLTKQSRREALWRTAVANFVDSDESDESDDSDDSDERDESEVDEEEDEVRKKQNDGNEDRPLESTPDGNEIELFIMKRVVQEFKRQSDELGPDTAIQYLHDLNAALPSVDATPPSINKTNNDKFWTEERIVDLHESAQIYESNGYEQLVKKTQRQNRLFKTLRGYMGLGPMSLSPGDEIYFLEDSNSAWALRRNLPENTHTFIGEVYVHGLMTGHAMSKKFDGRIDTLHIV